MVTDLNPGAFSQLKIKEQRKSQPRRAKKEPPMRQDIKKERLSKKYFSRSRKWFTLSNAAERSRRMNRKQLITELAPRHPGRSQAGAVFS